MNKNIVSKFLEGYSIEVTPRAASKIENFSEVLPRNTRVYIAHIEGTPIEEMVKTAKKIRSDGFSPMPHFPARIIKDKNTLSEWLKRYAGEADVDEGLVIAGGSNKPYGDFDSSIQLIETELFDKSNFKRLHVAGHPEGNKDIDPNGANDNVNEALSWKNQFSQRTDTKIAVATQFCFESESVIAWVDNLKEMGIDLPIHIGIAGPAKLQTLLRYSIECGVGALIKVLKKRAKDITKLLLPYEPESIITELAKHKTNNPDFNIEQVHFFPLGGIKQVTKFVTKFS
ncbi:MAG: methylenetetrahydrofolate reductase [SAR86 cluster bacterium]|uniref:Methylenetetrahydrofolate reductase n=1 Tax=SAR86 cluster bacterium TaxID=2030880 RepID=A0A520MH98_9GAMM|nr:MAG: methylenetetrahydrofolate reductase [SAR86 cluster bacterium]